MTWKLGALICGGLLLTFFSASFVVYACCVAAARACVDDRMELGEADQ